MIIYDFKRCIEHSPTNTNMKNNIKSNPILNNKFDLVNQIDSFLTSNLKALSLVHKIEEKITKTNQTCFAVENSQDEEIP